MTDWQPIETAPRDRELIGGGFYKEKFYWDKISFLNYLNKFQQLHISGSRIIAPSLWMDAPEPPP